ncbi:hypothetical protein Tco_1454131 [Tanacetum coccineum]
MENRNHIRTLGDYFRPATKATGTPLSSPKGTMWYLSDPTPSGWFKTDAHSTDLGKERACVYFNFLSAIKLEIGLNAFQQDLSLHGKTSLLVSLLNSFHREGLQNFKMTSLCSNNIKENLSLKHGLDSRTYSKKSLIVALIFGSKSKSFMTMLLLPQGEPSIIRPVGFRQAGQGNLFASRCPSTSDRRLIELENHVQRLMEAHLAPTQNVQVNKISSSCEICSGPHDTQYCMENPEQDFVDYTSSRTDEAGEGLVSNFMASQDARLSKFEADFKQQQIEMTNKIDNVLKAFTDRIAGALPSDTIKNPKLSTSLVLSARSYPTMDPQCSMQIHSSINAITIHPE